MAKTKNTAEYYTQRNNEIKPNSACNVTAMINALSSAGWPIEGLIKEQKQPEDELMHFIMSNPVIDRLWHTLDPACTFPPNEWHQLLATGTNMLLRERGILSYGQSAVVFAECVPFDEIERNNEAGGTAVVTGIFKNNEGKNLCHVVAAVDIRYEESEKHPALIIDDSWGDYHDGYVTKKGNDIEMSWDDYMYIIRPIGSSIKKAHLIYPYIKRIV